jgi:hypothetical protein
LRSADILGNTHADAESISVMEISHLTSVRSEDIVTTLQYIGIAKYWNGSHILSIPPAALDKHKKKQQVWRAAVNCRVYFDNLS